MDPIKYAIASMGEAIGAVLISKTEHNGADRIVNKLENAIGKLAEFSACDHGWTAYAQPDGTALGQCKKCGLTRSVPRP